MLKPGDLLLETFDKPGVYRGEATGPLYLLHTFSLFSDAGVVWNPVGGERVAKTEERWGAGVEIKNELRLFGVGISHAAGVAQPAQELFTDGEYDLYYRVRAVIPF